MRRQRKRGDSEREGAKEREVQRECEGTMREK